MNEYPDYTYTQSAAQYNDWMAEKYPVINDQIKQRIKEGRWEIVGGMWVEPDLNMPDGESTARSLLIGKRWYQNRVRRRRAHRLEPRLVRIQLAAAADLQEIRRRLLRHAENDLERHQPAAASSSSGGSRPTAARCCTYFPHDYANNNLDPGAALRRS